MEKLKGHKTRIYAFLLVALGGLTQADMVDVVPTEYVGVTIAAIGIVVGWLRQVTTSAPGEKF